MSLENNALTNDKSANISGTSAGSCAETVPTAQEPIYKASVTDMLGQFHAEQERLRRRRPGVSILGEVYFVTDGETIKIGYSGSAKVRLKELQSSHPKALTIIRTIPGTTDDEGALHRLFAPLHLRGEWFRSTPELREFIERVCQAQPKASPVSETCRDLRAWSADKKPAVQQAADRLCNVLTWQADDPGNTWAQQSLKMAVEGLATAGRERKWSPEAQAALDAAARRMNP